MQVIATAGHVDHGKSALVRALTGMEPDRWAEERRRGLTIDLGFAWLALPDGGRLAFVDVPGHERFVPNMLAGVGPVPAVLFVVAADGGWMPQSAEHLAAIDALGIKRGLLAVSRADLADPGPATGQASEQIAGTSLGRVPAIAVSSVTGQGLPELRTALAELAAGLPVPDAGAPVRLWVDRVFSMTGSGTVVTGTLPAGTVRTGDELLLAPARRPVRIRGIESLNEKVTQASGVARVAVNLRGTAPGQLARGMALVEPGGWTLTGTIDVKLADLPGRREDGPAPRLPRQVTVHIGSARTAARVRSFGGQFARLSLREPLPLHVADRLLLRDPGAARSAPGARVAADATPWPTIIAATVLDVSPPGTPRRGAATAVRRELSGWADPPAAADLLRRRGLARPAELQAMGLPVPAGRPLPGGAPLSGPGPSPGLDPSPGSAPTPRQAPSAGPSPTPRQAPSAGPSPSPGGAPSVGSPPERPVPVAAAGWLADPEHWSSLRERLARTVAEHAARDPLAVGMPLEAARAALGLPDRRLVEALAAEPPGGVTPNRTASGAQLAVRDGYVWSSAGQAPPGRAGEQRRSAPSAAAAAESGPAPQVLPARVADAVRSLRAELDAAPFRAPEAGRLRELGLDRKALAAAERAGLLLRITPELVLAPGADARAAQVLARLPQPFTTAQARKALDTTRRVAIPLLEYLDRGSVTQRLPDDRRMLRPG
jgi:selenocysteine-specific elongation factor